MGWSVGAFIVESLSVRASGSVRDHEVPTSASIDSRERPERRALSESPRFLAPPFVFTPDWCASSPPALSPVSGLFAVCARSSAPFVWIHTLLELGAQHTFLEFAGSRPVIAPGGYSIVQISTTDRTHALTHSVTHSPTHSLIHSRPHTHTCYSIVASEVILSQRAGWSLSLFAPYWVLLRRDCVRQSGGVNMWRCGGGGSWGICLSSRPIDKNPIVKDE